MYGWADCLAGGQLLTCPFFVCLLPQYALNALLRLVLPPKQFSEDTRSLVGLVTLFATSLLLLCNLILAALQVLQAAM